MGGMIFVETLYWFSFVMLAVLTALAGIDTSLEESARMCGASTVQVLRHITIPLLLPSIFGVALIVFPCVVSSFAIPAIVGGPGKILTVTTKIYQLAKIGTPESILQATVVSVPVILAALVLLTLSERKLKKISFSTLTGKFTRQTRIKLRYWRWPVFFMASFVFVIAVVVPVFALIFTSLLESFGAAKFSLANYFRVLQSAETIHSVSHSLSIGLSSALLLTVIAFFISSIAFC
jgi:iron(III) transport system permease protein